MAAAAASSSSSSSSFLGLTSGSRDPSGLRRRRPRGSRNRKKSWKRWGGPEERLGREIGDFLEDLGLQQRTTGTLLAEQPDEGIFFLDTGKVEKDQGLKKGKEKPLHVDLVLQPSSKVPPPKNILAYQIPNGKKEKRRREFWVKKRQKEPPPPGPLRRLQERMRRGGVLAPPPKKKTPEKGRSDPQRDFYDIWGDNNPLDRVLLGQDPWYLQQTKKQRVKRPPRLQPPPCGVPAVEVMAPGGSYNPTFEDHQALLLRAHEVEVKKTKEEERVERQLRLPPGTPLPTPESVFQEQCEGLVEEEEEEEKEEEKGERETPPQKTLRQPQKKTEQQRRREKEQKALVLEQRRVRAQKVLAQDRFRLRALRAQIRSWEEEILRRSRARREKRRKKEGEPRRLGRLRYEDPPLEVLLSTELPESLRTLKPEGNVLRDRFKSLQRRNLIEPRERAKFKRKYRVKYVEKRTFREVTLEPSSH